MTPVRLLPLLLLLLAGCQREEADLLDHAAWTDVVAADDPFEDRPAAVDCAPLSWRPEDLGGENSLEIDTTGCDYLALTQDSLVDVAAGESLEVRLWHADLLAPDAAEAHAAIRLNGVLIWETRLQIPGGSEALPAALEIGTWEADADVPAASRVDLHLHNHGQNAYNLIQLRRLGFDSE